MTVSVECYMNGCGSKEELKKVKYSLPVMDLSGRPTGGTIEMDVWLCLSCLEEHMNPKFQDYSISGKVKGAKDE